MPRVNKFRPGGTICGWNTLASILDSGRWVYLFGRPKHPSFIISMQFKTVRGFLYGENFRVAIPNEEAHCRSYLR